MKKDLLGSTAKVATSAAIIERAGFSATLSVAERRTLRAIVRKHHVKLFRDPPTNAMCDELIDALGPIAHGKMLLRAAK